MNELEISGKTPVYGKVALLTPRPEPRQPDLRAYYEAHTVDTLRSLWRHKLLLCGFALAGLLLGVAMLSVASKKYAASGTIHFDFARPASSKAGAGSPTASMDASALIEGEAQTVRSLAVARNVVTRLGLDEAVGNGLAYSLFGGTPTPPSVKVEKAARKLLSQVSVANSTRSYVVTVTAVANEPERAALIANTFLREYAYNRRLETLREAEVRAQTELAEASIKFGALHPTLIQAKAEYDAAHERTEQERMVIEKAGDALPTVAGRSFVKAIPEWMPVGPNMLAFLLGGMMTGLLAGIALIFLRERRDTGFRTEQSVAPEVGIRCIGMLPRASDRRSKERSMERREAVRSICLATGIVGSGTSAASGGKNRSSRVIMVSDALPTRGKRDFLDAFNRSLSDEQNRVLVIDASPAGPLGDGIGLDEALEDTDAVRDFFARESDNTTSTLRRRATPNTADVPFSSVGSTSAAFERLLSEARVYYDVIIIDAPPVLLFSDGIFLGRFADTSLLVADWNRSPRAAVAEAVRRLKDHALPIDGIILTDVDLSRYSSFATGDRTYYVSRHRDAFHARGRA